MDHVGGICQRFLNNGVCSVWKLETNEVSPAKAASRIHIDILPKDIVFLKHLFVGQTDVIQVGVIAPIETVEFLLGNPWNPLWDLWEFLAQFYKPLLKMSYRILYRNRYTQTYMQTGDACAHL